MSKREEVKKIYEHYREIEWIVSNDTNDDDERIDKRANKFVDKIIELFRDKPKIDVNKVQETLHNAGLGNSGVQWNYFRLELAKKISNADIYEEE